ncbi:YkvA family protein [Zavarzinia sp. CC-PAN008]|uniref:YkvA family protein n=1 Tax=Zavarzinia sp. CC-PAN008 TaxID=3243332 RepID=UPI003F7467D6
MMVFAYICVLCNRGCVMKASAVGLAARLMLMIVIPIGLLYLWRENIKIITIIDILILSGISCYFLVIFGSFLRGPGQFIKALGEWTVYIIWVPMGSLCIVFLLVVKVGVIALKLSLKGIIALTVSLAYFLLPIDLIPDFLLGLGWIDDIMLFVSLSIWAMSASLSESIRSSFKVVRPITSFP